MNLLTPQHRERGISGDTPDMLHARRRFLEADFYQPLLDRVIVDTALLLADTSDGASRRSVVEVGCGEGYYIGGMADALRTECPGTRFVGLDVSKSAVRMAAKRYPHVAFAVSNVRRRLYLHSASAQVLLSIFAPRNPREFARVVAPGGHLIIVIPDSSHLASLRSRMGLIGVEEAKEERILEQFHDVYAVVDRAAMEYPLVLNRDAIEGLVMMGPNRWHRPVEGDRLEAGGERVGSHVAEVATTASFVLLRLVRV